VLLAKKVDTPLRIFLSPFEGVTLDSMLTPVTAAEATLESAMAPARPAIRPVSISALPYQELISCPSSESFADAGERTPLPRRWPVLHPIWQETAWRDVLP
jgi:hypothetical protein